MKRFLVCTMVLTLLGCKNETTSKEVEENPEISEMVNSIDPLKMVGMDYIIDDQHSYVGFKIKYFGFSPVRGRFDTFDGTVFYDPEYVENTAMNVIIDVNSINTGNKRRDNDLITSEGWFQESKFPIISFETMACEVNPDGSFQLIGNFSMNGISKKLSIPFEKPTQLSRDWAANEQVDYSGKITIDRKDFDVFGGEFWDTILEDGLTQLSDAVEIELDIHTRRGDYLARYDDLEADNVRKLLIDLFKAEGIKAALMKLKALQGNKESALSSGAMNTVGKTLLAWKMYLEANALFEQGSIHFPNKTLFYNNLGVTQLHLKNTTKAQSYFSKALQIDSTDVRTKAYLDLLSK